MRKRFLLSCSGLFLFFGTSIAQITTATTTAVNAVQNVLLGGGVTATNITYTGYVNAIGTFTATTTTNLGIGTGVYLTSGSIFQTDPNNTWSSGQDGPAGPASNFQSVDQSQTGGTGAGDVNLDAISSAITQDAAVLEFDFVPQSDTIKFNYTFGSEEYNDFVNTGFNDVFGFFLTGPDPSGGNYTNQNVAIIPGTTTIVSINNVNNGNSGTLGTGPCTNCAYYRDNYNGNAGINGNYDGYTVVLEAKIAVVCGANYHIKLAVADAGDHAYDSGVFLEAGSFTTSAPIAVTSEIQSSSNDSILYEGCSTAEIYFVRPAILSTTTDTVAFTISGSATNGVDYSSTNDTIYFLPGQDTVILPISVFNDGATEGLENITITLTQQVNVCGLMQTITFDIYINDLDPIVMSAPDTTICAGTNTTLIPNLSGGAGGFTYGWTSGGSTVGSDSTLSVSPNNSQDYIVNITDVCGQTSQDTFNVQVPLVNYVSATIDIPGNAVDTLLTEGCDSLVITFTRGGNNPGANETYNYTVSGTATNGTDYLPSLSGTVTFAGGVTTQTISIGAVADGTSEGNETIVVSLPPDTINPCALQTAQTFTIYIQDLVPISLVATDTSICVGNSVTLAPAISGGAAPVTYNWTNNGNTIGNSTTVTVSPTSSTSYILTINDYCGQGPVVDTVNVTVNTTNFISVNADVINSPVDTIINEGCDSVIITFTRGGGNFSFSESFSYVVSGTSTNGTDFSPSLSGTVTFPAGNTTQSITLNAGNDGLTEGQETLVITIPPDTSNPCALQVAQVIVIYIRDLAPLSVIANDTTICANEFASISAAASGGGTVYSYTWNQGLGAGQTQTVSPSVTTNYIVTASHNCGTDIATDTATVSVLTGTPSLNPLLPIVSCPGDAQTISTFAAGGTWPYSFTWTTLSFDTIMVVDTAHSVIPSANYGGLFILTVTDACNEFTTDTLMVTVDDCELVFPNVVTPNGDGVNDALYFQNLEKYPNSSLLVYNRWGTKIFESLNYNNAWVPDVADGVYYYILVVPDEKTVSNYFHVFKEK